MKKIYLKTFIAGLLLNGLIGTTLSAGDTIQGDVTVLGDPQYEDTYIKYNPNGIDDPGTTYWNNNIGSNKYQLRTGEGWDGAHYVGDLVMGFYSGNAVNSLIVNSAGDISLADGSVWVDKSEGSMAIGGTDTTAAKLTVAGGNDGPYAKYGGNLSLKEGRGEIYFHDSWKDVDWTTGVSNWGVHTFGDLIGYQIRYKEAGSSIIKTPFFIESGSPTRSFVINEDGNIGLGTSSPESKLHAVSKFSSPAQVVTELVALDVNNTNAAGYSDTGFKLVNSKESVAWTFRTLEADSHARGNTNSFAISKKNSGGKELILTAKDAEHGNMLILANGAWCDGVWHNTSSRSMKKDIKPLSTKAAMETFSKLQPVTYAYKSNPTDQKVGFIAEDVPELVADPSHKSLSSMDMVAVLTKVVQEQEKILAETRAETKMMKKKVAMMESILTNLALDTSNIVKEKVSVNLK